MGRRARGMAQLWLARIPAEMSWSPAWEFDRRMRASADNEVGRWGEALAIRCCRRMRPRPKVHRH